MSKHNDTDDQQLKLDFQLPDEKNKKQSGGYTVTLDGKTKPKPKTPPTRNKSAVSTRSMTVKIPGETTHTTSSLTTPKRTAPKKPTVKPAGPKASPPKTKKTNIVRTVEQTDAHLVQSRVKKKAPTRQRVEPPTIGKRRGYRPSVANRLKLPIFFLSLFVCSLAVLGFFRLRSEKDTWSAPPPVRSVIHREMVAIEIESGMTARSVSLLLEQRGVVEDSQQLLAYFVENNQASFLRCGSYLMEENMSFEAIGTLLTTNGELISLTVSPAFTLQSIDEYLSNRIGSEKGEFLQAAEDLRQAYGLSFSEGWFLSGTYLVAKDHAALDLAMQMYEGMLQFLQPRLESEQVSLRSVEQVLIVASLIQAETQNVEEMKLIASVIYNRLDSGEPLGIDATTRYELQDWNKPIPVEALETKTPYNTRRKVGLPPSGICSPSEQALEAALYPQESTYFFYLHGLDKQIHFALDYEEHKKNISEYR
ncbi:MAG: endolytic transglycosylase MltG [Sphaerochaeta sp.]|nr:endolytic transglycosylase MltG [Sphaerochaeta sp.]